MITPRQIERLWNERRYQQLIELLLNGRADMDPLIVRDAGGPTLAAALAVIRLDELGQEMHPFANVAIRAVLAAQQPDGGWGDLTTTALALRALRCGRGKGLAIDRGINFLASIQKADGAWPTDAIRRLPADPGNTAFILLQLAEDPDFAHAARVQAALAWLECHRGQLPARVWPWIDRAAARWRRARPNNRPAAPLFPRASWS